MIPLFFVIPLFILTLFYIANSGGYGIALPFNLTFLCWLGSLVMLLAWRYRKGDADRQPLLLAGGLLLLVSGFMQVKENPGVWVLLGAVFLWQGLRHLSFTSRYRRTILVVVFVLALGQTTVSLLQVFCPPLAMRLYEYDWLRNHGRPYGIFQQVNLLASFLASGIGCGFLLLMQQRLRRNVLLCTAGLSLLTFVLVLNQSRAGAIGALLIVLCLSALLWRQHPARSAAALTLMIISAASAWYITQHTTVLVNGVPYSLARSYGESTRERWQMLCITWHMIMLHPWTGWGYGTFEYAFSRFVLAHPEYGYTYSSIVTHPHNELLYAWFQGGVVALSGMLLLFAGWVKIVMSAWRQGRMQTGYALLIIPLLVHLNLEYPFYQSFVHFGLFILLLRLGVIDKPHCQTQRAKLSLRVTIAAAAAALMAFSLTALYAGYQLTMFERGHLANFPRLAPWYFALQGERAEFDENVSRLIDYNRTHNSADLDTFMSWAARYSLRHNDKNVWQSMIVITQSRGDNVTTARLRAQYNRLFPVVQTSDSP
ncbi:O-antigen ligase C-terminal domain-containing protein [Cronobacter sakazakii]|uniref:PglL family O-oligosaccharyltransferase n=1 Tax=Cronobacter sakazakii TaxID=28141 RepID=UPI000CFADB37|nr:O-antigen ligase family protein [Cronobacter sakazakii]ELY2510780.1 O-antigen ligase C-terminal domain-containing protein [Cronobacter sakazakii]ELY2630019.1 O-antigen ligase C-terminal domain-containing protein [Cronobacter sakazakii]ELY2636957.1 O-antigen ligase C-terminal domain-containing protein [Cronobacter sakazakii]ELY2658743.1 O-antigen ligase C-terminal domain-containing protein [Cronobacter sakazakii]ELY4637917.1 O-antigen ligase C-terminal domain-containing protein [Cronobacter 